VQTGAGTALSDHAGARLLRLLRRQAGKVLRLAAASGLHHARVAGGLHTSAGGFHDFTPIHELTVELPAGAWVYGDKGYNSASDEAVNRAMGGGVLVPLHRDNMAPDPRAEQCGLGTFRLAIETVNSQLTAMGLAHLHVRSISGLEIKVHAALLALACLNLD
jgi:hypothetical protein